MKRSRVDRGRKGAKVISVHNLFDAISQEMPGEAVEELLRAASFRIERIVSRGQASPAGFWYDQQTEEWVLLVSGSATLGFDDGRQVNLKPGDHLLIPSHCRHRVERTDPERETVWLAVHWTRGA